MPAQLVEAEPGMGATLKSHGKNVLSKHGPPVKPLFLLVFASKSSQNPGKMTKAPGAKLFGWACRPAQTLVFACFCLWGSRGALQQRLVLLQKQAKNSEKRPRLPGLKFLGGFAPPETLVFAAETSKHTRVNEKSSRG